MLTVKLKTQTFEFDLINSEEDRRELIEILLIAYRNKFPFFINLLISICDIKHVENEERTKNELAYTKPNKVSERIDIFINFETIEKENFSHEEILFLIFHELLHNYLYHFSTFEEQYKSGNGELANIVMDFFVNHLCEELIGVNKLDFIGKGYEFVNYKSIYDICRFHNIKGLPDKEKLANEWTEMELYNFLAKHLPKQTVCKTKDGLKSLDDHSNSFDSGTSTNTSDEEEKVLRDIIKSKMKAKEAELEMDNYTAKEGEIIQRKKRLLAPVYFLNELKLKRIINKALEKSVERTYRRTNRKKQFPDFVLKGKKKINGFKLVIGIDVSGSISDNDLDLFLSMLYGLYKKNKSITFDIIFWSSTKVIENRDSFKNIKDVKQFLSGVKPYSSGGTEIEYFHDFLNKTYEEPIEVINITDGCFNYNKKINENILKYHFVITEHISNSMISFYNKSRFEITSIKDVKQL